MLNSKILTIAIPIYNTERYLTRCLESIVNIQQAEKLDIILINDGSPDRSDEIASDFARRYPHGIRYIRKDNGGWGSSINLAIQKASGKYFKILDSDDYYQSKELDAFLTFLASQNADLVLTSMTEINSNGQRHFPIPVDRDKSVLALEKHLDGMQHNYPLGMTTYRTELLQENKIRVSERYYADLEFNLKPLAYTRTVAYRSCDLYQYDKTREEASTSTRSYAIHRANFLQVVQGLAQHYVAQLARAPQKLRELYKRELITLAQFGYNLYLSPTYAFNDIPVHMEELRCFDTELSKLVPDIARIICKSKKKGIPYILIWKKLGINILNLRTLWTSF